MELELCFSGKEVKAWDYLVLMKRVLDCIEFGPTCKAFGLPAPGGTHDYAPEQLVQQFMLSAWWLPGDGGCAQHG